MVDSLSKHIKDLKNFDMQRIMWLKLSAFVFLTIIATILDFFFFDNRSIYWALVPIGLVISVAWWYWTMKIIRILLTHRIDEVVILKEIVTDVKEVKNEIKKLDKTS